MIIELLFVLAAIVVGARLGGVGLGVSGGLGLAILVFCFGLEPTSPPIDVMLMIAAVIAAASCMQRPALHTTQPSWPHMRGRWRCSPKPQMPAGRSAQVRSV